ncbi:hypothetical protein [Mesorhizobium sp. LSHC420B00]|uniref:hypothetical protein n=1 Tax=Mesorhizobium sp. LSHC420B00 TaxID=1287292 RepID=UPI0026D03BE4
MAAAIAPPAEKPVVETVGDDHRLDHLADRKRLARTALGVVRLEPFETEAWIVAALLLVKEQGEPGFVRKSRPSGVTVVRCRSLGAAMQHDDERSAFGQFIGKIKRGPQRAGFGTELGQRLQMVRPATFGSM